MARLVGRRCKQCGIGFDILECRAARGNGQYCSRPCFAAARDKKVQRICRQCEIPFMVFAYLKNTQTCCSQACAGILSRTKVTRKCRTCGKSFLKNPSQFKYFKGAGKYCSRPCAREGAIAIAVIRPSKDRHGRTNRHADKLWKEAVRKKDASTCQKCGKVEKHIHTHHVAPRSRRPDLKHDVANGKCLCGSCHQWVHWNPKEATAMGLLSDATYERARKLACKVCGEITQAHGLCSRHYARLRRHGDPLMTRKPGRPAPGSAPFRD